VKPYYSDDLVTLYHADCLDLGEWCGADVLITDPPYGTASNDKDGNDGYGRRVGNQRGAERVGQRIENDESTAARDTMLEMWGERPGLVFGSPRIPEPPGEWADRLVWDKGQMGLNSGPWRYQHESIFVRGFERRSVGDPSILKAFDQRGGGAYRPHPHFKPVALMEHLIERSPAGVIADPFSGSGSTVVAARNLGRHIVAVEIEERYCELTVRRLSQQAFDFEGIA
jgi:hypothetical protein